MKIKLTWRIWLWIAFIAFALISIFITPTVMQQGFMQKGVLIKSVTPDSFAFETGLRAEQVIIAIDRQPITNVDDYLEILELKSKTEKEKTTITTINSEYIIFSENLLEISVSKIPLTNLKLGLDLAGGSRAFIEAENHKLTTQEVQELKEVIENRLNAFGLSDMKITTVSDLFGNNRLSIEIAGATPKDLKELISQQGKFEAKIGNETVFVGGKSELSVTRTGSEVVVENAVPSSSSTYVSKFHFPVTLSQTAAERFAEITKDISVNATNGGEYLSKNIDFYLDDNLRESLLISSSLKGQIQPTISISGSGTGTTAEEAETAAQGEMKKLQTILITGSLPFKLTIVKLDTISSTLGNNFVKYLFLAGIVALVLVAVTIFLKYKTRAAIAPLIVCTSEIFITLGIAAFMKWDLDLMAIAGILAAIGTGVDDQIVVLDETRQKEGTKSMKQKIKNAFTIVFGAYFTSVASLLPLAWVGGGLLKGFVLTTLTGITLGVLVTRPAFADIVRLIEKENAS
jgi:preprotein translocase subunit SecD